MQVLVIIYQHDILQRVAHANLGAHRGLEFAPSKHAKPVALVLCDEDVGRDRHCDDTEQLEDQRDCERSEQHDLEPLHA